MLAKLAARGSDCCEDKIKNVRGASTQGALADMAFFPAGMLVGYLLLIGYFARRADTNGRDAEPGGTTSYDATNEKVRDHQDPVGRSVTNGSVDQGA